MRRLAFALLLLAAGVAHADERRLADEFLGWCWARDLLPAASEAERAVAPKSCVVAAAMWADVLADVIARDGAGTEDGTRSIAVYVAACMAMNDVRASARTENGRCTTRDRRMAGAPGGLPSFAPAEGDDAARGAAMREAELRLAALLPDGTPADDARAALEALGFVCDPAPPADSLVCLFSHRELAYAHREPTLFASVFWNLELVLDAAAGVSARRVGVETVHP